MNEDSGSYSFRYPDTSGSPFASPQHPVFVRTRTNLDPPKLTARKLDTIQTLITVQVPKSSLPANQVHENIILLDASAPQIILNNDLIYLREVRVGGLYFSASITGAHGGGIHDPGTGTFAVQIITIGGTGGIGLTQHGFRCNNQGRRQK